MTRDPGDLSIRCERHPTGEQLEQHTRQGVLVAASVDRIPVDLLGRHVVDGADGHPGSGQPVVTDLLGDAEVGQVTVRSSSTSAHQDVGRLHVPVNEPAGVRGVQRSRDLVDDLHRLRRLDASLPDDLRQIRAVDELHREVDATAFFPGMHDRDDVRVIQRGGQPRFAAKPGEELGVVGDVGVHHLDRDGPIEREVLRPVHRAHAAAPGQADDGHSPDYGARCQISPHGDILPCSVRPDQQLSAR